MPHIQSAKKRLRQNPRRRVRNQTRKTRVRTAGKAVIKAVQGGDVQAAQAALKEAVSAIDRAAKRNVIHKNSAARKKSRLARAVNQLQQQALSGTTP